MGSVTYIKDVVAAEVARQGSLEPAISALSYRASLAPFNTAPHYYLAEALAQRDRAEREASETLDQRCFRLGLEAADHDKRAEDFEAEAAQDDLVVKVRRDRWGADDITAARVANRARAGRMCAADQRAEADRLRSQAAALRRAQSYADDVVGAIPSLRPITVAVRRLDPAAWPAVDAAE